MENSIFARRILQFTLYICIYDQMGQACCIQVDQSSVGIKEKFGKYTDVLEPGCHCVPWFLGYKLAGKLSMRVQQLDVRCETKTKVSTS